MKKSALFLVGCVLLFACKREKEAPALPTPEITRLVPAVGYAGDTVRIAGTRFQAAIDKNTVAFNGQVAKILSLEGDTVLRAIVPPNTTSGPVTVANQTVAATGPVFTILVNRNPPRILSVSSQQLETGEALVIMGANFVPGADSSFNTVRIGGIRALVQKATASQLTVVVPPNVAGNNLDVSVSVQNAVSNALKLNVSGFVGTLFWTLIPAVNLPNDGYAELVASARADGGSLVRNSFVIPDDSAETKEVLKYSLAGPKVFSAGQHKLYSIPGRDTLWSVGTEWNNFQRVLTNAQTQGVDMNSATAMAIHEASKDLFIAINSEVYQVSAGQFTAFSTGGITKAVRIAAGRDALCLIDRNANGEANLKKIPYGSGNAIPVNTASLPPVVPSPNAALGILDIMYSPRTRSMYLVFAKSENASFQLYQWNEQTEEISLLVEHLPATGGFTLLDAATGPKLYYIGKWPTIDGGLGNYYEALSMINLKPTSLNAYYPVELYKDVRKLPGRPTTFLTLPNATNSYQAVDFLMVDDN